MFYVLTNALQSILQANGLAWAQPVADLLSTALVTLLYLWTSRRMMAAPQEQNFHYCLSAFFSARLFAFNLCQLLYH